MDNKGLISVLTSILGAIILFILGIVIDRLMINRVDIYVNRTDIAVHKEKWRNINNTSK